MAHVLTLLAAFALGFLFGVFFMAFISINRENKRDREIARLRSEIENYEAGV